MKKFRMVAITFPDGSKVLRGPNGFVDPPVPCHQCGRSIRYYRGPVGQFPWYCSKQCAAGETVKVRCDACHGALRKPILFGTELSGKKWVTCKSCSLRMSYLFSRLAQLEASFVKYAMEKALPLVLSGDLKLNRFRVVGNQLVYLPKALDAKEVTMGTEDPIITTTLKKRGRPRKVKVQEPEEPRIERVIRELQERGTLDADGRFKEGLPFAGKLYRDVYPDVPAN